MSNVRLFGPAAAAALVTGGLLLQPGPSPSAAPKSPAPETHAVYTPEDLKWVDGPPSLPKGSRVVMLEGDPSKPGPFTARLEFPANYKIMPHSHPGTEHITILSGEFYMGFTDKFDEGSAQKLGPGSFVLMPSGKHVHYAFTKGQKTVVQLHGVGPWDVKYVNPGEDPRRNK